MPSPVLIDLVSESSSDESTKILRQRPGSRSSGGSSPQSVYNDQRPGSRTSGGSSPQSVYNDMERMRQAMEEMTLRMNAADEIRGQLERRISAFQEQMENDRRVYEQRLSVKDAVIESQQQLLTQLIQQMIDEQQRTAVVNNISRPGASNETGPNNESESGANSDNADESNNGDEANSGTFYIRFGNLLLLGMAKLLQFLRNLPLSAKITLGVGGIVISGVTASYYIGSATGILILSMVSNPDQ